jgi:putative acetyltransferase
MPSGNIAVQPLSPHEPAAQRLLAASDEYMASLYPAESNHLEATASLAQPHVSFFGAFADGELLACGALKRMDDDGIYGEIKRLFVDPAFRGRGLAKRLMTQIEEYARQLGLPVLRLETGISQPEATGLYETLGYKLRGPFGNYREDPLSLFMEKDLPGV